MEAEDYLQEMKMRSRILVTNGPIKTKVQVGDRWSVSPELGLWYAKFACPSMITKDIRQDRRGVLFVKSGKKEITATYTPRTLRDELKSDYVEPTRDRLGDPWFTLFFVFADANEELNQIFSSAVMLSSIGYNFEIAAPKLDLAFYGSFEKFAVAADEAGILTDSNAYYVKNVLLSENEKQDGQMGPKTISAFSAPAPF